MRALNNYLRQYTYIQNGNTLSGVNLHTPKILLYYGGYQRCLFKAHRQLLHFAFEGMAYEYQSLPFSLTLADTSSVLSHCSARLYCKQCITFLVLMLDSLSNRASLMKERVQTFISCLSLFRRGHKVHFRNCLRLLCLMASTIAVIPPRHAAVEGLSEMGT